MLCELRLEKNLKQDIVANAIGVSRQAYSKYETNLREPDFETLIKLADFYNVSIDYLLGRSSIRDIDSYYLKLSSEQSSTHYIITTVYNILEKNLDKNKMEIVNNIFSQINNLL